MNLEFNYFGQNDTPELILCNPDDTEIGVIVNVEEFSPTVCFSDISEISYKIYKTDDEIYNELIYDKHIERRQVKVVGTGYFIIKSSPEFEDDKGKYKTVQAQSCESELNNIEMPYIDGTYCLYSAENFGKKTNEEIAQQEDEYLNENCILYEIMSVIPSWTLGGQIDFVENDKYIELAKKFRTFEGTTSPPSVYSFFKNEIQDSYECFVDFDIEKREIFIRTYDDVFKELSMIISEANILNSCEISTPIENYVNCLNVSGTNGVNISTYNPLGNSLIYNFDHDINIGLIDGVLKEALIYWKNSIQNNAFYSGLYCDTDIVQKWIDASIKRSKYKKDLLEAIGTGEETKITSLLNDSAFLTNIGLIDNERTDYIKTLQDAGTNTSLIDNVFIELSFKRASMLSVDKFNSYEGNIELYKMKKFLYSMQELQLNIESEISSLNSYLNGYNSQVEALKVTVVETEENQQKLDDEIEKVNSYITTVNSALEKYENILNTVKDIVNNISSLLSKTHLENQFQCRFNEFLIMHPDYDITVEKLYANLTRYIKQQTYTDENIIVTDAMGLSEKFKQEEELYNSSVNLLENISIPAYEISIGAESFLFSKDFKDIIEKLNINSTIYVELPNGDVPLFHLLKIAMNYDENTCELVFGNRLRLSDPTKIFSDLQQNIASSASIIAAERVNWGIQEEKVNELMRAKTIDIDTTFRAMSNSFNKTTFGDDGFRCYAVNDEGLKTYGMWCANGTMMFTDGETPKMAIGRILKADGSWEYGFYGQSIIANTITADKIRVGSVIKGSNYIKNGSFELTNLKTSNAVSNTGDETTDWVGFPSTQGITYPEYTNATHIISNMGRIIRIYKRRGSADEQCGYVYTKNQIDLPAGNYVVSFDWACDKTALSTIKNSGKMSGLLVGTKINSGDVVSASINDSDIYIDYPEIVSGSNTFVKTRFYKKFTIDKPTKVYVTITNQTANYVLFDDIMLERSEIPNEYTPHIGEYYAKYTTINDNGVNIYGGKLNIFNNDGSKVLSADNNGNLTLTGKIEAKGGHIGSWGIDFDSIYYYGTYDHQVGMSVNKNNAAFWSGYTGKYGTDKVTDKSSFYVTHNGYLYSVSGKIGGWTIGTDKLTNGNVGMSTKGNYAFYAGNSSDYNFSVTHDGYLMTKAGQIANWTITAEALSGGKLVLIQAGYITEFDGRSLRFGTVNSSGSYSESDFGSCISMMKSSNHVFNNPDSDNLSIAGRNVIQFGLRGDSGNFEEVGRMYKFSYSGNSNNFNKNVLDINSVKLSNIIIGNVVYKVSADTVQTIGTSGVSTSTAKYLRLDAFSGIITEGLFNWIFG